ncbi:MAG TPA: MBL fold metallo-hydrolase [Anaerolineae bacterium]|nr:MBL fold metallo-hydrolase [Anaerolineae bacterium]HQH38476.1 MBL fold metallo-hydrolase [Anaerolineae bacterium]
MYWERVSEETYLFTSDRYALVNSIAVATQEGIVIIDALPFPDEAKQIVHFLEVRIGMNFHSFILTHHHMDHVYGLFAFPEGKDVIAHELCRRKLLEVGEASLKEARQGDPAFEEVVLRIPNITFNAGELLLRAGGKNFRLLSLPGHTDDNIGVLMEEEEILIAGDAVMAIPIIADGDWEREIETLTFIKQLTPEMIVQGHGEVILRGEVQIVMDRYITYLECVYKKARNMLRLGRDRKEIWNIPLEDCGLERVPLGIASHRLHVANIMSIYDKLKAGQP